MTDLDDWATPGPSPRAGEPDPFDVFDEPVAPPVQRQAPPRKPLDPKADGDFVPYKIPTNRGRRVVSALVAMGIVIVALAGGSVFWVARQIDPPGEAGDTVQVVVEPGMNVSAIADRLQEQGIISNATIFRWYAGRQGGIELTPGVFELKMNDSMGNIIDALETTAEETYVKVTFPEGFTLAQMAARLEEKVPRLSGQAFLDAAASGTIVSRWAPPGTTNFEGLLFPDTYRIYGNWDEARVVQEMVSLQERIADAKLDIEQRAALLGRTPYEVLVVASLIEREAKVPGDRPKIARVIYNRLAKGWNLDIDATVLYAAPGNQTAVTKALIEETAASPYNTYKNGGHLPPTPIAAPGRASIEAALQPADGPWMFYVLANADGTHVFAETYEEHLANVEAARAAGLLGVSAPRGSTTVAGVIGHPVRHSLSPVIHNAGFAALGLDWVYVAFPVQPGHAADALAAMRALEIAGLNVTMPHKSDVAAAVDVLTPEAAALGSVNTVTLLPDGRLEGRSTDGPGLLAALAADGVHLAGQRVGLVGAGGAARAVAVALAAEQVGELVVVNRSAEGAERTAALAGPVARVGSAADLAGVDVLVNAVPVGMDGASLPVPAEVISARQTVVDLIYHPAVTPLLALAGERGARAINGLGMLIHQAALAFERWTGQPAPVEAMHAAVQAHLAARAGGG